MNFPRFLWAALTNCSLSISNLILLSIMLIMLPVLIGQIWLYLLRTIPNTRYPFLIAWVSGFITLMAAAQIVLVPLTITRQSFAVAQNAMAAVVLVLLLVGMGCMNKRAKYQKKNGTQKQMQEALPFNGWAAFYGVIAICLILGQGFTSGVLQHRDDDDTRWITEENIAVDQGKMFTQDLVTNEDVTWNLGEQKKDIFAPWPMFMALIAKTTKIAPAVLSHTYIPMFLIPLAYAVYALFVAFIFQGNREKTGMFLIIISAIHIYGYSSTHTTSAVLIFRMWQGKADVGAWLLPLALLLMLLLLKYPYNTQEGKTIFALAVCNSFAASLASSTGTLEVPVVIGICGLLGLFFKRNECNRWLNTFFMWLTAVPCVIYLVLYTFAQKILGY